MDCSEPFTLSIALMAMMPSAVYSPLPPSSSPQSWFALKLRAREQAEHEHCQRLLTAEIWACGVKRCECVKGCDNALQSLHLRHLEHLRECRHVVRLKSTTHHIQLLELC